MNIAFLYAYNPCEIWNTPISLQNGFIKLGHKCFTYPLSEDNIDRLSRECAGNVDIVIHMDCGQFFSQLLCKSRPFGETFYVFESGDDPQAFRNNQHKAPYTDLVLSPDKNCCDEYKRRGINAIWWTHFADEIVGKETKPIEEAKYDVVSTRGDGDTPFLDQLKNVIGDRFCNRRDFSVYQAELLSEGRIVIQNSRHKEVTRRVFEGMMAKRLVLTDRLEESTGLYELFEDGKDFVVYDSLEDAVEKINYYSNNLDRLKEIAESGYQKVLANHTNITRAQEILNHVL